MRMIQKNLFIALLATAATLAAQSPLLNVVVNAAGNPAGSRFSPRLFPNSGIANSSVFLIWGSAIPERLTLPQSSEQRSHDRFAVRF